MKVILVFAGMVLVLVVLALRAIRQNAGVPSLDDPKQVTPPPARDMFQTERRSRL